jgi:NAD(P)H-hydrate epimerase
MVHIEAEAYRDGASEQEFMEEAGSGVALVVQDFIEKNQLDRHVVLMCGKGNNAGDAYVAGIHLMHLDFHVFAYQLAPISSCSQLCQQNYHRFLEEGGNAKEIASVEEVSMSPVGVIVDGIFGTGFKGNVDEPYASIIQFVNQSKIPIIAVDIPSGLNGENGEIEGTAIVAAETAFLGLPKTGFFLLEGWNHVGKLQYVDYGLPQEYIEESQADLIMLTQEVVKPFLPSIKRNRHKYEAGFVVGLGGSPNMPGAAILASYATLRGGAGIVHLLHPAEMETQLAACPIEVIKFAYDFQDTDALLEHLNRGSATFIGPGIGRSESVKTLLDALLPNLSKPCVIDADALTILAEEKIPLPKNAILTPHLGEMHRLLNLTTKRPLDKAFLKTCQRFAEDNQITLLLKGGPSFIFHPGEPIFVNPTGDPGMATAGSGDVLTGLLAALLAQGCAPREAAALGVFLHGWAGEIATLEKTSYGMVASDILESLPDAFMLVMR